MNSEERHSWPSVIIGGAPRSGTSSLYNLLLSSHSFRQHPRKELFLLNDDGFWIQGASPGYTQVGADCYDLAGFRHEDHFIDASTTYLYQNTAPTACARWLAANRDFPFVVVFCLREPAERFYSNFRYFRDVLLLIPGRTSFREYVDSVFDRVIASGNQQIDMALEHGLYPRFLERWEAAIGAEHIVLVQTETLEDEGHSIATRIGKQIGVELTVGVGKRRNRSYQPRYRAIQSVGRLLGSKIGHGRMREFLKDTYMTLVPKTNDNSSEPEDLDTLQRVRLYYREQRAKFAAFGLSWYETV